MATLIQKLRRLFTAPYVTKAYYLDEIMTVTWDSGKVEKFMGECTVWHRLPNFKRASTSEEEYLSDLWEYITYFKKDYEYDKNENL